MATSKFFNGKNRKLPGVYARIISGIKNPPQSTTYGNILIIDTNSGAGFGGGSGVKGELKTLIDSVYSTDNIKDFRSLVKGGLWWLLAKPLFQPNGVGSRGVSKIDYVRAATTTSAVIKYNFGNNYSDTMIGDSDAINDGGTINIQTKDEGLIANGTLATLNLSKGYAGKLSAGTINTAKFVLSLYLGTFKGLDTDGDAYDSIANTASEVQLVAQSPEINTVAELLTWMAEDAAFNAYFKVKSSIVVGTGAIDTQDLTNYSDFNLATGGTETFTTARLDEVLEAVKELDYSFVLCDQWGNLAQSADNSKILTHIVNDARFEKAMFVAGGKDVNYFTGTNSSIDTAEFYDSDRVIVCHGGVKIKSQTLGTGFKEYDSIYKAAICLGRICGLEPQIPGTFKGIEIDGELHTLTQINKEQCLDAGVLCTAWDADLQRFAIVQAVNSLQKNTYLLNEDASSYSIQLKRIVAQVNKTLEINAKIQLFGPENTANRYSMSVKHIEQWVTGQLQAMTVTTTQDNLLLSFNNITVVRDQDMFNIDYQMIINGEVTKLFISGTIIG